MYSASLLSRASLLRVPFPNLPTLQSSSLPELDSTSESVNRVGRLLWGIVKLRWKGARAGRQSETTCFHEGSEVMQLDVRDISSTLAPHSSPFSLDFSGFVGFKELCPDVRRNSVLDAKFPWFSNSQNNIFPINAPIF